MSATPSAAEAFLILGQRLSEAERDARRLPLPPAERVRVARMAAAARESFFPRLNTSPSPS